MRSRIADRIHPPKPAATTNRKIHRDLLLAPLGNPDEIARLPGEWATALSKIFDRFTPIVIGYGGNDGSLMGFLQELSPIEGGIFWCYRGAEIEPKIHEVVEHHRGKLVPIVGFDEVMLQLQEKLKLDFLLPKLQTAHVTRVTSYQKQFEALTAALRKPAETVSDEEARKTVRKAAEAAVERLTKERDWWAWQLKADAEPDPTKKEAIFRAALEDFPKSAELNGNFAVFMHYVRKNYDESELLFRKSLELDPHDANRTGNFAVFMSRVRNDHDGAERLFRASLEIDPNNVHHTHNFALFLFRVRKQYDESELLFRKALELDPTDARHTGNYASFMATARKQHDEAERLFRKALELDPSDISNTRNFAQFMSVIERRDEARYFAVRAWRMLDSKPSSTSAEVAFTIWLLDCAAGSDGLSTLGRLKTILAAQFEREMRSFLDLLKALLPRLPKSERQLAKRLARAILDENQIISLNDDPIWQAVEPIPLDEPWPELEDVAAS